MIVMLSVKEQDAVIITVRACPILILFYFSYQLLHQGGLAWPVFGMESRSCSTGCDKPKTREAKAFLGWLTKKVPGNATKLENNEKSRVGREAPVDIERERERVKRAKKAFADAVEATAGNLHDELTCPMKIGRDRQKIALLLKGMTAAVKIQCAVNETQQEGSPDDEVFMEPRANLSGNVAECDGALEKLVVEKPDEVQATLKGLQKRTISWEHRSMGAFLFLHPRIYGNTKLSYEYRVMKVA